MKVWRLVQSCAFGSMRHHCIALDMSVNGDEDEQHVEKAERKPPLVFTWRSDGLTKVTMASRCAPFTTVPTHVKGTYKGIKSVQLLVLPTVQLLVYVAATPLSQ